MCGGARPWKLLKMRAGVKMVKNHCIENCISSSCIWYWYLSALVTEYMKYWHREIKYLSNDTDRIDWRIFVCFSILAHRHMYSHSQSLSIKNKLKGLRKDWTWVMCGNRASVPIVRVTLQRWNSVVEIIQEESLPRTTLSRVTKPIDLLLSKPC